MKGYNDIRCDRGKGRGGGCMTFIKLGIPYRFINTKDHECVVIEIFNKDSGNCTIINYYNPCKVLNSELLKSIVKRSHREIWCGDFNAHNSLWGSKQTDLNGEAVEEMMNDRMLVCLNNGYGTRINIYKNETSCIDLTLVDRKIASRCEWEIDQSTSMGSDHFPITCAVDIEFKIEQSYVPQRWNFKKADWEKFVERCGNGESISINNDQTVDEINSSVSSFILDAAGQSIPVSQNQKKQTNVPW